jgi:hypothetical protein
MISTDYFLRSLQNPNGYQAITCMAYDMHAGEQNIAAMFGILDISVSSFFFQLKKFLAKTHSSKL